MRIYNYILLLLFLAISACQPKSSNEVSSTPKPTLVVISMDGFRWDYTDSVATPNFDRIAQIGVKAKSMQASFPTKTFPNHYALATGLYPDHNGIVNNTFFDPERGVRYSIGDREKVRDAYFYEGEPIWNTVEKQGLKSAILYWVGSEAPIQNIRPSIWKTYDHNFPFEQRIDTVISWLQYPENTKPQLIMWYVDQPDGLGHRYGPFSKEANSAVEYLDGLLGDFMNKLSNIPNGDQVNVILLSDHGMAKLSQDKQLFLDKILKPEWTEGIYGGNPIYNIKAKEGYIDSITSAINKVKGVQAYKNTDVPERLHYGTHPRTLDLLALADSSYTLLANSDRPYTSNGTHGYDNRNTDMDAIFYAYGPAFKTNYSQPRFQNVSVYPLFCRILGLEEAPNDGDINELIEMLK